MRRVVWARTAVANPFGQERYQAAVIEAVLALAVPGWSFHDLPVRSLRSPLPGRRRLPTGVLGRSPLPVARAIGSVLYPRGLVHRFDLRLPPARHEVVSILDGAPLRFPDEGTVPSYAVSSAKGALGAICCSSFAAEEARELFGVERTWVAHAGVEARFFSAAPEPPTPGPYVLHAGGSTLRKNLDALAAAWRSVHAIAPELSLVLVGPPSARRTELFRDVPGAVLLGQVADSRMPGIMAAASAVVVPSTYEGFGMPALEAMASGTPVVAAAAASLPEVVGDAGWLVQPTADGLAEGILRVLEDDSLARELGKRGRLRAEQFTWGRSAEEHLRAYTELIA